MNVGLFTHFLDTEEEQFVKLIYGKLEYTALFWNNTIIICKEVPNCDVCKLKS